MVRAGPDNHRLGACHPDRVSGARLTTKDRIEDNSG